MFGPIKPETKKWFDIIGRHLTNRGKDIADLEYSMTYKEAKYVVRMCAEIALELDKPIEEVLKVERMASGHTDYHRKFAMYCYALEMKK